MECRYCGQAEFRRSFLDLLDRELVETHSHIVTDSTVSEDILELWAVCKLVPTRVPKGTPQNKVFTYCEFIFNALMSQKYGGPVPEDKMFRSRVKELIKEIHIIETESKTADLSPENVSILEVSTKEKKWEVKALPWSRIAISLIKGET